MRAEYQGLTDLAASVADGTPVDWNTVRLARAPAEQRLVRHLRLVESIASLHRSIPHTPEDDDIALIPRRQDSAALPTPSSGPHWGRLTLLERIGQGTSCEVYRAWDRTLHREVALKLLHQDGGQRSTQTRLLEEARRLARLRHEHVVQVYGAEQHNGRVGLWMELIRGDSLEQIVKKQGLFGPREAALIGLDVCSALAAVHAAGLLHRDVKAQNVMRDNVGRVVLMDFGTGEELSGTNRLVGTPLYLPPEIFRGQKASVQSDLYSLGVLLFYLVTGKFPVVAESMEQLAQAHALRERQPLRDLRPDIPEAFVRTVERALDSDPARRFQSVGDLEAGLREAIDSSIQPSIRERDSVAGGRRLFPLPKTAAIAASLLLVVGAAVYQAGIIRVPFSRVLTPASGSISSVAVLPLMDQSDTPSPTLAEALTDQMINTVGQIGTIRVTSRGSVMPLKNATLSAQEIGRMLRVDAFLESSMVRVPGSAGAPDQVRVNARLVLAATDALVWARSFERQLGDILSLQADIARAIADGVQATVTDEESERLGQVRRTNPQAEEAFLSGRYYLGRYGVASAEQALTAFEEAVRLDPRHAGAYAGAARARVAIAFGGRTTHPEARARALADVRRALQIDPDQSDAHAALADLRFFYDWDAAGADAEYRQAIELNPSFTYARTQYARYLAAVGRHEEARNQSTTATALDPRSVEAAQTRALVSYYRRDYQSAGQELEHALTIDPGYARAYYVLGRVREAEGRLDEAIAATERAIGKADEAGASWRVQLLRLKALSGQTVDARRDFEALQRELAERGIRIDHEQLAYMYLGLGDQEAALAALERAVADRQPSILWMAVDPRLDTIRAMPRYQALVQKLQLR